MPKTKKPPNGPGKNRAVVSTTVDLETSAEIDRLAKAGGLTRSQWAREALTDAAQEASIYSITKNTQVSIRKLLFHKKLQRHKLERAQLAVSMRFQKS
jgi:hypothetical protein